MWASELKSLPLLSLLCTDGFLLYSWHRPSRGNFGRFSFVFWMRFSCLKGRIEDLPFL